MPRSSPARRPRSPSRSRSPTTAPCSTSRRPFNTGSTRPGVVATAEGLKRFDTDGSPLTVGSSKSTTKGPVEKDYQTPYGVATVARHVYQGPRGGLTYCPLDRDARIVVTSAPRFAKILSHKYAEFSSP